MREVRVRELNDLIVSGEAPEIDKLIERIEASRGCGGWSRELETERALRASGRGRSGVYCYSWAGRSGLPPASLFVFRRNPRELASSSILPAERKSLTDRESNDILASFAEDVIRPLTEGLEVETTIVLPQGSRLEWSLSPAAFSKLNWFASMVSDPSNLTPDDRARWDDFWYQAYSDGSIVEAHEFGEWLKERGFSENQAANLIARSDAGMVIAHHGGL